MKKLHLYLVILLSFSLIFAHAQWTTVGDASAGYSSASPTNITFSSAGTPYLYYYNTTNAVPQPLRFDGTNWDTLGSGLSVTTGVSDGSPSEFALSPDTVPFVACRYNSALAVFSCNAGVWSALGSTGVANYSEVSIAADTSNAPYVAYTKASTNPLFYDSCVVITYSNGSWSQVGGAFPGANISIVVNNNVPYVLYSDSNNFCNVMEYNGSNWVYAGAAEFSTAGVSGSSIQIGSNGVIYVAYSDTANGNAAGSITVVKLVDTTWTTVGNGQFATGQLKTKHCLAVDPSGNVFVTYIASNAVSVMGNEGDGWFTVGATGFGNAYTYNSSIAVSPSGVPYVAYDSSISSVATVKDYVGVINSIQSVKPGNLQIYPNPANDFIYLNLPVNLSGEITLYDITGKAVISMMQTEMSSQRIDLGNISAGVYLLSYRSGETSLVAKVVKQ